jgi:hypothetical protein
MVRLLAGQDTLRLFPLEQRRVGNAALHCSQFGTGWVASQPRRAHHGEICGGMHVDERDLRTARLPTPAEPPDRPARSPACDDVVIGVVRAQMMDAQNEVEAFNLPAWKVE